MPTRFERWMRSKLLAMTARTPSSMGALGGPVARRAGAVLFAGQHHERHAGGDVLHGRVVDGICSPPWGRWQGDAALDAAQHEVLEADVGEGAAHHHLVVAAAGAVLVEVGRGDAVAR
jgi:hypothetical protein